MSHGSAASQQSTAMSDPLAQRRRRAIYRASYRGTKEMDWLLGKYGAAKIPGMTEAELADFERMLTLPDPQLQGWLMNDGAPKDHVHHGLIEDIRSFHAMT
jgi:antitoxin CptB